VQVCTDVGDCPAGDSCRSVGFGGNAVMECVAPPPPMDAGADAGDAGRPADAGSDASDAAAADSGPKDAATGG
jgi:hypothetical protein